MEPFDWAGLWNSIIAAPLVFVAGLLAGLLLF